MRCPQILDRSLWETSGHWENYRENMFTTESENRDYAVKPMNCPGHVQIFNAGLRSYRDLPLRYGEFGSCHRNEPSGALHGIMRVRGFTQDDGHIFCTEDQIQAGVRRVHGAAAEGLRATSASADVVIKLATAAGQARRHRRDLGPSRAGAARGAEGVRRRMGRAAGRRRVLRAEDRVSPQGRHRPLVAVRHDAGRFRRCRSASAPSTSTRTTARKTPVMLHRAIVGSLERFIGILIENYAGAMPLWLAPVQVVVLNISEHQADYAEEVAQTLRKQGFRVVADLRNEKISYKIREHSLQKLPYQLVVGDKRSERNTVAVRARAARISGVMPVDELASSVCVGTSSSAPARGSAA